MLKDRVINEHISLEDALLKSIMEGIELVKQDRQEKSEDLED
jgi:hypothetical protein